MPWSSDLKTPSFGGIPFEFTDVRDSFGRRVAEHEYPYRQGADLDDMGQLARPSEFTAVFYNGPAFQDGAQADYLERLNAFLDLVKRGITETLVHPLFGSWQAKIITCDVEHSAAKRDFATVTFSAKEDGAGASVDDLVSIQSAEDELIIAVAEVDAEHAEMGTTFDEVDTATADARLFVTDLQENLEDLSSRLDQLRKFHKLARIAVGAVDDVTSHRTRRALYRSELFATKLKERHERNQPKVVVRDFAVTAPTSSIANRLYKDPKRSSDLDRLNRIRNPFFASGRIRTYSR